MEASELRMGNWVLQDGAHIQITGYVFHAEFEGLYEIEDEFKPIPLTPEILEKAGFTTLTPVHLWEKESFGTLTFKLKNFGSFHFFDSGATSFRPAGNPAMILRYEPKHLHQLQNLYFALTGEELPIEL